MTMPRDPNPELTKFVRRVLRKLSKQRLDESNIEQAIGLDRSIQLVRAELAAIKKERKP